MATEKKSEAAKEQSFENNMQRLEEIVRILDSGSAPLDESLSMFEEGVHLVSLCNSVLEKAESRIKILEKKDDGEYEEKEWRE